MLGNLTNIGKLGLVIFLVGVVHFVVGFSVPHWVIFHFSHWRFGLWEGCESKISVSQCVSTLSPEFKVFRYFPGWFRGAQACACLALAAIGVNIIFRIVVICLRQNTILFLSVILDIVAAAFGFLGAVLFGSEVSKYGQITLSWGFVLYIVGGVFLVGAATCFLVEYCRQKHKEEEALHQDRIDR